MESVTKIKNIQLILNRDPHDHDDLVVDGIWGKKTQAALDELLGKIGTGGHGEGSWYSQYEGRYTWVDTGDGRWNKSKTIYLGPNNALGVPDDQQGIALYNKKTLGKWFMVKAPNGGYQKLQQTDVGPHPRTGRKIDIAAVAAEHFGYSPRNFPTGGIFHWTPV